MNSGSQFFMLIEEEPVGIVSVKDDLIEDLYILPQKQRMGYGTKLLIFAAGQCTGTPSLWILENIVNAKRFYHRMGFKETGRKNVITDGLDEIEYALTQIQVKESLAPISRIPVCCEGPFHKKTEGENEEC